MREYFLDGLYADLEHFREMQGGYKTLADPVPAEFCAPGVYFFFQEGITRRNRGQLRVMRVGKSKRRERLHCHRGNQADGGGDHRGSVFRKHIGNALINRDGLTEDFPYWNNGRNALPQIGAPELPLEVLVSEYIRQLRYIYLPLDNLYHQKLIEERCIELLSNSNQMNQLDVPIGNWLGFSHPSVKVRQAHLWNIHYINNFQRNNRHRYEELLTVLEEVQ